MRILATAALVAALTAGSASAWSISGQPLISTSGGKAALVSVAKPAHLAGWAVGIVAAGWIVWNSGAGKMACVIVTNGANCGRS